MKRTQSKFVWPAAVAVAALISALACAQTASSSLEQQFRNPPDSAKPRAWWHWMSGNVTEPGITADLEWMHRVGIAGMQMFDGDMGAPLFVDKPVIWMSPEWKSAWRHAAAEPIACTWRCRWRRPADGARPRAHGSSPSRG